jgi:hypothetical protein
MEEAVDAHTLKSHLCKDEKAHMDAIRYVLCMTLMIWSTLLRRVVKGQE